MKFPKLDEMSPEQKAAWVREAGKRLSPETKQLITWLTDPVESVEERMAKLVLTVVAMVPIIDIFMGFLEAQTPETIEWLQQFMPQRPKNTP